MVEDDESNPQKAKSAMEKLITMDKVDLVVGGYTSSCTAAMAGTAEDLDCPLVIDCGSADEITTKPVSGSSPGRAFLHPTMVMPSGVF